MFTGIIEELGTVRDVTERAAGVRIDVAATTVLEDAAPGASVAVNGTCLTVTEMVPGGFCADVMAETLRVTGLGSLRPGDRVNLERPVRIGGRLDGHIVQGHVDGVGTIGALDTGTNETTIRVEAPPEVLRYCVPKGSVTLDGISLTLVEVGEDALSVSIIPHTWDVTNLHTKKVGDPVNLEADVIAKYVERLVPGGC